VQAALINQPLVIQVVLGVMLEAILFLVVLLLQVAVVVDHIQQQQTVL
jgi:hypothetical protein